MKSSKSINESKKNIDPNNNQKNIKNVLFVKVAHMNIFNCLSIVRHIG